jgi:hypothetical protein
VACGVVPHVVRNSLAAIVGIADLTLETTGGLM